MKKPTRYHFIFLAFFLFFFLSRIIAHYNLQTSFFDQYYFDNPLWNTTQGRIMCSSIPEKLGQSILGGHFTPLLFVFTLPYFIYPSSLWMFAFQSLFVAGIATLIISFADKKLSPAAAKLIVTLLITNVTFRYMGFHDFHPDVIIAFLLTLALYTFYEYRKAVLSCLIMISGFLAKEVAGITIASYGLFITTTKKGKAVGIITFIIGVAGVAVIAKEVIPQFTPANTYMFSSYYTHLGSNIYEQITHIILHPIHTLSYIFNAANLLYVFLLLAPLAFLPFYYPQLLLAGTLPLFVNLLSNYRFQKDITVQYSYVLIPVLFFSAILAIKSLKERNLWDKFYRWAKPCIIFFISLSVIAFILLDLRLYIPTPKVFAAHQIMRLVPPQASLSASDHLIVHLQYRDRLFRFPDIHNAEYVIFEDVDWWLVKEKGDDLEKLKELMRQKAYGRILRYLIFGVQQPTAEYIDGIKQIINDKDYIPIEGKNGIFLYKRHALPKR